VTHGDILLVVTRAMAVVLTLMVKVIIVTCVDLTCAPIAMLRNVCCVLLVWCVVCGVWCVVCGVWCVVCRVSCCN
jgi:hypothetical protein